MERQQTSHKRLSAALHGPGLAASPTQMILPILGQQALPKERYNERENDRAGDAERARQTAEEANGGREKWRTVRESKNEGGT